MRHEHITNKTVNGVQVLEAGIYKEGANWRWQITDRDGREYLDSPWYPTIRKAEALTPFRGLA